MKKILCFGDICPDLLIPYGAAHIAGSRPSDTRVRFSHGGSAANTASGLGRLGIPVLFAGSAGEDGFGRALRRGLEEDGVDTRCLKLYPELMTMEVLIVVDAQGERTPFAFPQTGASQHHILPEQVPEAIDFASVDVSFISLKHIFPNLHLLLRPRGQAVCLIKPQFEAGREKVGKKGVVREKSTHHEVIEKVTEFAVSIGFSVLEITFSPIKGPEGNIEYLVHLKKCPEEEAKIETKELDQVVDEAFAALAK